MYSSHYTGAIQDGFAFVPLEISLQVLNYETLARVGGAEGYCNHSVCLSVGKIPANLRTIAL